MSTSVCVCVCVCLSVREDISGTMRAIFTKFRVHVAYGRGSILLRGRMVKSQGKGAILGVLFPINNELYNIAFGIHIKRLNRSRCRLGWWVGLAQLGTVCYVGDDPWSERGNFGGKHMPDKPNTIWIAHCAVSMQRRAHNRGRRLITSVGRVYYRPQMGIAHRGRSLISMISLFVCLFVCAHT